MIGRRSALYKCSRNSSGTGVWSDGSEGVEIRKVSRGLRFFFFFFSFLVLSKETREKLVNGHHERSLKINWCLSKARQNVIFFFFSYFSPFSSVGDFLTREKECYGVYRVTDIVCRRVSAYKFL